MNADKNMFSDKQLIFKELFVGTLIYAVVLGFFNDYTSIVYAKSFSTIFLAAVVLEALTYLTLLLKSKRMARLQDKAEMTHKAFVLFTVWLVLFLSKFVFIWAIDLAFGDEIAVYGFFGITGVIMSVTIAHKLADKAFAALGK